MFDWIAFLDEHRIEYETSGHNVTRGNVAVRCPFCSDDPSFHMGVSLQGKGFHCWRDDAHSGRSPAKLIQALLDCSFAEAISIAQRGAIGIAVTEDTFADDLLGRLGVKKSEPTFVSTGPLTFLDEFQKIRPEGLCKRLVYPYLNGRGYSDEDITKLAKRFNLRWAYKGKFAYRIIIPVEMDGRLVNWTGRSIAPGEDFRYRSLSSDPNKAQADGLPVAPMNIKHCLFDWDELNEGGHALVICEGPFDAMRISFLGEKQAILGTCLFSKTPSDEQLDLISDVKRGFNHMYSMFDEGADLEGIKFPDKLGIRRKTTPAGIKDPALLTREAFNALF